MRRHSRKGTGRAVVAVAALLSGGCAVKDDEGGARNAATERDSGPSPAEPSGEAGPHGGASQGGTGGMTNTGGSTSIGGSEPVATGGAPREVVPYPPVPLDKCPEGLPGPALVPVPGPSGTYCIDATEVTLAQYRRFVEAGYTRQIDPMERGTRCVDGYFEGTQARCDAEEIASTCDGNLYEPTERVIWPPAGAPCHEDGTCGEVRDMGCVWWLDGMDDYPINCIDWCDAAGYCEWAGKRLCGSAAFGRSELIIACEGGWWAGQDFADSSWDPGTYWASGWNDVSSCNFAHDDPYEGLAPVGALKGCEGGYPGLFDLKGNVYEFLERSSNGFPAAGGAYDQFNQDLSPPYTNPTLCGSGKWLTPPAVSHNVGFRCCADALREGP
jgi:formylglycine-generating enzyme